MKMLHLDITQLFLHVTTFSFFETHTQVDNLSVQFIQGNLYYVQFIQGNLYYVYLENGLKLPLQ